MRKLIVGLTTVFVIITLSGCMPLGPYVASNDKSKMRYIEVNDDKNLKYDSLVFEMPHSNKKVDHNAEHYRGYSIKYDKKNKKYLIFYAIGNRIIVIDFLNNSTGIVVPRRTYSGKYSEWFNHMKMLNKHSDDTSWKKFFKLNISRKVSDTIFTLDKFIIEYVDYSYYVKSLNDSTSKYNKKDALKAIEVLPKDLISSDYFLVFKKAIIDAKTHNELNIIHTLAEKLSYQKSVFNMIKNHKYKITFNKNYNHYLTKASENELTDILNKTAKLEIMNKDKILKVAIRRSSLIKQRILSTNDITEVRNYYKRNKSDTQLKKHLISLYRKVTTTESYMKAFRLSSKINDLKLANKYTKTFKDKLLVEKEIVKSVPLSKIFNIKVLSKTETKPKKGQARDFMTATNLSTKNIKIKVKITPNPNSGIKLKYANYKIKVKFKLTREYDITSGVGNAKYINEPHDPIYKEVVLDLNKNNNYTQLVNLDFDNVEVYGKIRHAMTGLISMFGGLFGQNISRDDLDIKFELKSTAFSYEVINIK